MPAKGNARTGKGFWATPVVCVIIGLVYLATGWSGHQWGLGISGLVVMLVAAVVLVIAGRRFETVREVLSMRDERVRSISQGASSAAGHVLILAVVGGALVELARGNTDTPFTWLGALAGVTYAGTLVVNLIRR